MSTVLSLVLTTGATNTAAIQPGGIETTTNLANLLNGLGSGSFVLGGSLTTKTNAVAATAVYTLSTSSGVLTATINGIALATSSLSGTDTQNAAALAAVINASSNALIAGIVTATSALGVVTVTCVSRGIVGNSITTTATGTGNSVAAARMTGGTNGTNNTSYTF